MTASGDHGLADQLQPVQHPDGGQDVGCVGTLPAAHLEQAELPTAHEQLLEQALLSTALDQPGAELAQHRGIKARIGQLEAKQVLPIDPGAHRLGGLSIGQVFAELQQGDQGQPPRREPGLAALREEVGEVRVGEDGAEFIAQLEERIALAEGGSRDARGLRGHGLDRAGLKGHGRPPRQAN